MHCVNAWLSPPLKGCLRLWLALGGQRSVPCLRPLSWLSCWLALYCLHKVFAAAQLSACGTWSSTCAQVNA